MRNTTKKSFALSLLAPLSPMKGKPMRKLTKEQKRDIQAVATKSDEDIDFSDAPRFSTGAAPKSASSTGQRRNPSRCAWIPTSSHGSRPMAAVIRLRRIGFYDTPCFTTPERRVGVVTISSSGVARPDIRKERPDSRLPSPNLPLEPFRSIYEPEEIQALFETCDQDANGPICRDAPDCAQNCQLN